MAFAVFIIVVLSVFVGLLNVLPGASAFPLNPASAFTTIIATMKAWNFFLPIYETLVLVAVVITFEVSVWVWKVSWSVVKFLRGHSDGS